MKDQGEQRSAIMPTEQTSEHRKTDELLLNDEQVGRLGDYRPKSSQQRQAEVETQKFWDRIRKIWAILKICVTSIVILLFIGVVCFALSAGITPNDLQNNWLATTVIGAIISAFLIVVWGLVTNRVGDARRG